MEFGSTNSKFLQFAYIHLNYKKAVGILLDVDGKQDINSWQDFKTLPISFITENELSYSTEKFDMAFSQEIFGLLNASDLKNHAQMAWDKLNTSQETAVYYSTFCWHKDNPHSSTHEQFKKTNGKEFFLHSLDDIAEIFHEVGFEVGIKKLTLPYFLIYDKDIINKRFGKIQNMINSFQEHTMIFAFRKWSDN